MSVARWYRVALGNAAIMMLLDVIVPVLVVAAAGFLFGRWTRLDMTPLTRLSFYVLSPALIFHAFVSRSVAASDLATTGLFVVIFHGALFSMALLATARMSWDRDTKTSAVLSFSFNNCGNYGLPVLLFAFGEAGFALGVAYMIAHLVFQVVFGVGIAQWQRGIRPWGLMARILRVPWLYALAAAMVVRGFCLDPPAAIVRPVELVAGAAIPVQLLLLGMSLAKVEIAGLLRRAVPISVLKLAVAPLLAWGFTAALGVEGLLRTVLILEASTPTAVNALVLSLQFDRRAELTASVVLLTTMGGLAVTSLLLWILT